MKLLANWEARHADDDGRVLEKEKQQGQAVLPQAQRTQQAWLPATQRMVAGAASAPRTPSQRYDHTAEARREQRELRGWDGKTPAGASKAATATPAQAAHINAIVDKSVSGVLTKALATAKGMARQYTAETGFVPSQQEIAAVAADLIQTAFTSGSILPSRRTTQETEPPEEPKSFLDRLRERFTGASCAPKESPVPTPAETPQWTPTSLEIAVTMPPSTPSPKPISRPEVQMLIDEAKGYANDCISYKEMNCSKFTQAIFRQHDDEFPGVAYRQWKHVQDRDKWDFTQKGLEWRYVSTNNAASIPAGALVFYSAPNCECGRAGEIHHVAIACGDGMMVDSTDREDIDGISTRSIFSDLTYKGDPMEIVGCATIQW